MPRRPPRCLAEGPFGSGPAGGGDQGPAPRGPGAAMHAMATPEAAPTSQSGVRADVSTLSEACADVSTLSGACGGASMLIGVLWFVMKRFRSTPGPSRQLGLRPLLVQSRWSMLAWKLMCKHHLKRTGQGPPPSGSEVARASMADSTSAAAATTPDLSEQPPPAPEPKAVPKPPPPGLPARPKPAPPALPVPNCPRCGMAMVMKRNRGRHGDFWGCQQYPACEGMLRPWIIGTAAQPAGGTRQPPP